MKILLKINILLLANTFLFASTGIIKETSNVRNNPSLKSKIIKQNIYNNDFLPILTNKKVYKNSNFNSEIVTTIKAKDYKGILSTKYIKDYNYPWYKIDEGWINTPFLNINNFNDNSKININKIIQNNSLKISQNKSNEKKQNKVLSNKTDKKINTNTKTNHISNKVTKPYERSYNNFLGISAGYSYMDAKKSNIIGNIPLNEDISTNGMNINFELGIRYPKYFYTLNYENINYSDVKFNRFFIGAFKPLTYKYNPYIGVIAGMSFIELKKAHFNTTIPKAMGKSNAFGFQFGLENKIYNNWSFNPYIRYIHTDHKTILKANPARAKIIRNNNIDVNIGFRYDFY